MTTKALTQDETIAKINRKIAEFKKEFQGYSNIMSNGRRMFLESQTMDEMAAGLKIVRLAREVMKETLATQGKAITHMMNTLHDYGVGAYPPQRVKQVKTSKSYFNTPGYDNPDTGKFSGL